MLFNKYFNTIIYLFIYIVASWLSVVILPFRCALLRGLLLWVTVLGVRCFVACCCGALF